MRKARRAQRRSSMCNIAGNTAMCGGVEADKSGYANTILIKRMTYWVLDFPPRPPPTRCARWVIVDECIVLPRCWKQIESCAGDRRGGHPPRSNDASAGICLARSSASSNGPQCYDELSRGLSCALNKGASAVAKTWAGTWRSWSAIITMAQCGAVPFTRPAWRAAQPVGNNRRRSSMPQWAGRKAVGRAHQADRHSRE